MTQQEQQDNHLQKDLDSSGTSESSLVSSGNEIVYIAELDGEFFTVDYSQDEEPNVTPLKVVEYVKGSEPSSRGELASYGAQSSGEMQNLQLDSELKLKPQKRKLSENKSLAIGIGLGLLIAWGGTKFLGGDNSATEPVVENPLGGLVTSGKRAVTVTSVTSSTVDKTLEVSGTVEALESIPVTSQAVGLQITEVLVDEGNDVTKGQVLAKLRDDTVRAEFAQAQATVSSSEARLAELQAGTRSEEVAKAQQRVKQANASLEQAKSDLELASKRVERNRNLEAQGAIARDRLDEIISQERVARAALSRAEASLQEDTQDLQQLQKGERPEVISQAKAELARAQGQLQFATVQLNNTQIVAPANGVISQRNAKVGDVTANDRTLFSIIENGALELRLQVPETDLRKILPQQKVIIKDGNQSLVGLVREIDPIVDSNSRLATVKVNLPPKTRFQPGMFVEAAIATEQIQGTTVPIEALLPKTDNQATAFILGDGDRVESRNVKMGDIVGSDRVEVLDGLTPGEKIVVKGAAYLKNGDQVEVKAE